VERFGKAILVGFESGGDVLVIHLGMTGNLILEKKNSRDTGRKHRHAILLLDGGIRLVYYDARRFGYFWVGPGNGLGNRLNVGPDPFQIRVPAFREMLGRRTAPVKSLLLNQKLVSGLGNIYVDEALFRAGIHPVTPGRDVARNARDLLGHIRVVLRNAIRSGGSTIRDYRRVDGSRGGFQNQLAVYGRTGESCLTCGEVVQRIVLGGRSTHFCPRCQRGSE
jgi:formamidopyrimidine-DNA glycosylase